MRNGLPSVSVWFTCTLQPRRDPAHAPVGFVQLAGEPLLVTVKDVPPSKLAGGRPSYGVLWQAEETFLETVEERYPAHDLIAWEARDGGPGGALLSSFEEFLPSHLD